MPILFTTSQAALILSVVFTPLLDACCVPPPDEPAETTTTPGTTTPTGTTSTGGASTTVIEPRLSHVGAVFIGPLGAPEWEVTLYVQGANIGNGAVMVVNGADVATQFHAGLAIASSIDPATLGFPITGYGMVKADIEVKQGDVLSVRVRNPGNALSDNERIWTVPDHPDWDTDGDGLKDEWETNGYVVGGSMLCDLPALGADPEHFDLFVEADFMAGAITADPRQEPSAESWPLIEAVFRSAPLLNISGPSGIRLHVDRGQSTYIDAAGASHSITASDEIRGGTTIRYEPTLVMDGDAYPDNFNTLKGEAFDPERRGTIFHYCIFGHASGHASALSSYGYAEMPGNDLFVTLPPDLLQRTDQATAAFVHELGHNLGLQHGGDDAEAAEWNHCSIMSYQWCQSGVDVDCDATGDAVYDLSQGAHALMDLTNLDERIGLCDNKAQDWNGNGTIEPAINWQDKTWDDHDNWGSLLLDFKSSSNAAD